MIPNYSGKIFVQAGREGGHERRRHANGKESIMPVVLIDFYDAKRHDADGELIAASHQTDAT